MTELDDDMRDAVEKAAKAFRETLWRELSIGDPDVAEQREHNLANRVGELEAQLEHVRDDNKKLRNKLTLVRAEKDGAMSLLFDVQQASIAEHQRAQELKDSLTEAVEVLKLGLAGYTTVFRARAGRVIREHDNDEH